MAEDQIHARALRQQVGDAATFLHELRGPVDAARLSKLLLEPKPASEAFAEVMRLLQAVEPDVTRPDRIVFEAGAALAQIAPVRRGDLELFEPELRDLANDSELFDAYADAKCARQAGDRTSYTRPAQVKRLRLPEFADA